MADLATTDLSDAVDGAVQHCEPIFQDYGGHSAFYGPIVTLKTFEDNAKVREAVEGPGEGRVLVVDGGGSLACALVGGNLAKLAAQNGWAGIVVNGCVRDRLEIAREAVGVKALAHHPKKSVKGDGGRFDVPVTFAGVSFLPGHWLYADLDGIIVSDRPLHD